MSDSTVRIGGVRITEVATMVTDFVIAGICVVFGVVTARSAEVAGDVARAWWADSFLAAAVAAGIGGVVHGFALHLSVSAKHWLWKATQYVMGLTALAILAGGVAAFTNGQAQRWLLAVAVVKFALYAGVVSRRDDYTVVVIDYGASMLAILALAVTSLLSDGAPASPWLLAGVVISAIAAAIQIKRIAPHPRFNHNDLYHVVQIVALYLFYRGGLLLVDR